MASNIGGISDVAAIAIGASVGGVVLIVVSVVLVQALVRHRQAKRGIAEIVDGYRTIDACEVSRSESLRHRLHGPVPYGQSANWKKLSSDESLHHTSTVSQLEKNMASASAFPASNHPANNLSPRSKLSLIHI